MWSSLVGCICQWIFRRRCNTEHLSTFRWWTKTIPYGEFFSFQSWEFVRSLIDIGRVLIARFFRTLFDGGVSEVSFLFKQTKETFHNSIISIDCEQGSMITCFGKPAFMKVRNQKSLNLIDRWYFRFVQTGISTLNLLSMISCELNPGNLLSNNTEN